MPRTENKNATTPLPVNCLSIQTKHTWKEVFPLSERNTRFLDSTFILKHHAMEVAIVLSFVQGDRGTNKVNRAKIRILWDFARSLRYQTIVVWLESWAGCPVQRAEFYLAHIIFYDISQSLWTYPGDQSFMSLLCQFRRRGLSWLYVIDVGTPKQKRSPQHRQHWATPLPELTKELLKLPVGKD